MERLGRDVLAVLDGLVRRELFVLPEQRAHEQLHCLERLGPHPLAGRVSGGSER